MPHGFGTDVTSITLRQHGNKLSGTSTLVKISKKGKVLLTSHHALTGSINDRIASLRGASVDRRRVSAWTFLGVVGDGDKIDGTMTWYDMAAHRIGARECSWTRKESYKLGTPDGREEIREEVPESSESTD